MGKRVRGRESAPVGGRVREGVFTCGRVRGKESAPVGGRVRARESAPVGERVSESEGVCTCGWVGE